MSETLLPFPWIDLVLILALIALNGVLAMSEMAIVSSREARLRAMAKNGSKGNGSLRNVSIRMPAKTHLWRKNRWRNAPKR